MMEDRFLKRLRKKARKGLRGWPIASCILWSEPQPSDEGHRWHRAIRECRCERVARLEGGSRRYPRRPRYRPGDIGIYRPASSVIGRDDGLHNRLPSSRRNRLRRRMVSSLRVLARTRSLYGADGQLDSRCSYRGREHRPRAQCHGGQSIGLSVARASQNDRLQPSPPSSELSGL